jgi:mannonate dehydratase
MSQIKLGLGLYRHMLTDENFAFARQCGCTHLVIHLADYYSNQIVTATDDKTNYGQAKSLEPIWQADSMIALQKKAQSYGLTIYAIENFSPADWYDVLLDGPKREAQMEHLKEIIRNTGKAGIRSFGYNFSLAGVWGHQKERSGRGGAYGTCFDASRIKLDAPITNGEIWNMTYHSSEQGVLEPITSAELWARLRRFLEEILPVAEESGVELALHPDDPPLEGLRGMPRLVYQPELYQNVIDISSSNANKLEFCMGSIQEMTHGNIYDAISQYAGQNRISYIHFRNVKGKVPKYQEVFVDDGDIDMPKALALLEQYGFNGVIIPDHTPEITCGAPWHAGMAYALGYMRAVLQMLDKQLF